MDDRQQPWTPQTSLRDLAIVVFRRKWSILTVFFTAIAGSLIYLFVFRDNLYEIESKILVKIGREQAPPTTMVGERPIVVGYRHQDVNSEVDILTSTDLLSKVVDELHLDVPGPPEPPPPGLLARVRYEIRQWSKWLKDLSNEILIRIGLRERLDARETAIQALRKRLRVESTHESNVLAVYLLVPVRQGSSIILNKLLEYYVDFRLKIHHDPTALEFFTAQVDKSRRELEQAEEALREFEIRWNIHDQPHEIAILLDEIAAAQTKLTEAAISYHEAEAKVARIASADPMSGYAQAGAFPERSFPETLLQQLTQLRLARLDLLLKEPESSEKVRNNEKQAQFVGGVIEANLQAILAERKRIYEDRQQALDSLNKRLTELHEHQARWTQLKREIQSREEAYQLFEKKLHEAKANEALEQRRASNVVVVQHAMDPLAPAGLRKQTFLAMALGLAVLAALGWAAILEFFDHRVYTARDLAAHFPAAVLAVAPRDRRLRLKGGGNA